MGYGRCDVTCSSPFGSRSTTAGAELVHTASSLPHFTGGLHCEDVRGASLEPNRCRERSALWLGLQLPLPRQDDLRVRAWSAGGCGAWGGARWLCWSKGPDGMQACGRSQRVILQGSAPSSEQPAPPAGNLPRPAWGAPCAALKQGQLGQLVPGEEQQRGAAEAMRRAVLEGWKTAAASSVDMSLGKSCSTAAGPPRVQPLLPQTTSPCDHQRPAPAAGSHPRASPRLCHPAATSFTYSPAPRHATPRHTLKRAHPHLPATRSLVITGARILGVTVEQALEAYGVFFVNYVTDQVRCVALRCLCVRGCWHARTRACMWDGGALGRVCAGSLVEEERAGRWCLLWRSLLAAEDGSGARVGEGRRRCP